MVLETGYVYHIKNEYFDLVKDDRLMLNHEGNSTRPNYFCIKNNNSDILWFIPMSSRTDKYKRIINQKLKKYRQCDTIVIGNYRGRKHAFLIQNIFPIIEKYIDHIDTVKGEALQVPLATRREIIKKVNIIFKLKSKGINLIFPDVDRIESILINEIDKTSKT